MRAEAYGSVLAPTPSARLDVAVRCAASTSTPDRLDQILDFCAEDPVERVFLEDVARRGLGRFIAVEERGRLTALCHVGANVVPSGRAAGRSPTSRRAGGARMLIGEEGAVAELWDEARRRMPRRARTGPASPSTSSTRRPSRARRPARGDAATTSTCSCPPAPRRTSRSSASIRSAATRRASAGARRRRSRRAAPGSGARATTILFKAEASAWTPRAVQIQQVWVDPEARTAATRKRGMRDLCRRCSSGRRPCACSSVPRTRRRSGSTSRSACAGRSRTGA